MAKKRRKKKATSTTAKKVTRRRGRPPGRRTPTPADPMSGAMTNLEQALQKLRAERDRLDEQINALEGALAAMGRGPAPAAPTPTPTTRGGRGRRGESGTLRDYVQRVMKGRGEMQVRDITDAVIAAGYPTQNKTLAKSVGIVLTQLPNVKKTGRGRFVLS